MKICILDDAYENSDSIFKAYDPPADPIPYLEGHTCERHYLQKATAVRQVHDLARRGFDVFLNLCDGSWDEDRPGIEVVQALERLGVAFTGATAPFFDPSREQMKRVCHYRGIPTPAYVMAAGEQDLARAAALRFPLIVKHPNSYSSIGMTRASRVETPEALHEQAAAMIDAYGQALIEEFIEGREFSALVAENPDDAYHPIAYRPVEFHFPEGESFKHFDLKWKDYYSMTVHLFDDPALACRIQDLSRKMFLGLNGTGYGRCDLRMDEQGTVFMLEINPNCELFYAPEVSGSADFILLNDPEGHKGFVDKILRAALARQRRKVKKWTVRFDRDSHYGMYAVQPIAAGELIEPYEEQPHVLVSKTHAMRHWSATRKDWFARYAYPLTDEVYVMWSSDPEHWKPLNHACDPNAWLDGLNLVARRAIAPGEEITMDFATFCNETMPAFECACASPHCRGTIRGTDYREPFVARYDGHVSDYVRSKRLARPG